MSWCQVSGDVAAGDTSLLARVDEALLTASARSRPHLRCRPGCTPCCIGPFDITVLDAARLLRWLVDRPKAAAMLRRRAREAWDLMSSVYPGDSDRGLLSDDEEERQAFFTRFADVPCPALEPSTGACEVYGDRPLTCRTFGLPIRYGDEVLAPCELNFRAASPCEIEAATTAPDPDDEEGLLLASVEAGGGIAGDTIVAAVLASTPELETP